MKKIIIIGSSGAGKSTISTQLSEKLHLELYHLDKLFWKPGWELCSKSEQISIQEELLQKDTWIIDGNYGGTLEMRVSAADTIIFLDLPRLQCVYGVCKRILTNINTTRPDMGEGCPERLDFSFLKWTWNFNKTQRPHIMNCLASASPETQVIHLTSRKAMKQFLDDIKK